MIVKQLDLFICIKSKHVLIAEQYTSISIKQHMGTYYDTDLYVYIGLLLIWGLYFA